MFGCIRPYILIQLNLFIMVICFYRPFEAENGFIIIKNTIPCGQTNLNPKAVDNTCLSSWQNINNA